MPISTTTGCCSFPLRISGSSPGFTSLSQCCPFLVQMPLRSRLMSTLNGENNPIGSNNEYTKDKIFLSVIGASISLFVLLHTRKLSSVTVHCNPSTEDPSVLGSNSTCFVLLIDFKSSGIALVTASLLLVHFFNSNPYREKRGCSWLKTSVASSGVSTDWCQLSGLLVFHGIWILFQSTHVADQVLLVAYHLGILLCILRQHCKHVLLCHAYSGLALDCGANTILYRSCLSLRTLTIFFRIIFLHLYLLIVDTNFSSMGHFGIFAPVSKAHPRLSWNYSVGLALFHSTEFSLQTARLWISSYFLASSVPAVPSLTDWRRWFWRHRFLCPTRLGYSQPLSYPLWRQNDKHFVFFCPSWVHWLPILALLERRKVHFVFLSCSPMGVVAHNHLDRGWCQLPSSWRFYWVWRFEADWSFASACDNNGLCSPRKMTGVKMLRLNAPLNVAPLFWEEPFLSSDSSFRVCQLCWASHRCLGLVTSLAHFDRWMKPLIHYRGKHMYSACCQRSVLRQELSEESK